MIACARIQRVGVWRIFRGENCNCYRSVRSMADTADESKFRKLVNIIKKVHSNEEDAKEGDREYKHLLPLGHIYGRVTSHPCDTGDCGPLKLSESVGRETVFIFGNDTLEATVLESNTFDTLVELGLTKEMIIKKVS